MNQCIKQCSKPLQNQQNYALAAYSQFNDRLQSELQKSCIDKPEGPELDICIDNVKVQYLKEELPETQN